MHKNVAADNANSLEIADAEGKRRVIVRDAIDLIQRSDISVMPEGFETKLNQQEMADVMSFVGQLGN